MFRAANTSDPRCVMAEALGVNDSVSARQFSVCRTGRIATGGVVLVLSLILGVVSIAIAVDDSYIAGYAERKDGAAIITRLMDTIQKTAAVIIEAIEARLLGERGESEEAEEVAGSSYAPRSYESTLVRA